MHVLLLHHHVHNTCVVVLKIDCCQVRELRDMTSHSTYTINPKSPVETRKNYDMCFWSLPTSQTQLPRCLFCVTEQHDLLQTPASGSSRKDVLGIELSGCMTQELWLYVAILQNSKKESSPCAQVWRLNLIKSEWWILKLISNNSQLTSVLETHTGLSHMNNLYSRPKYTLG